ncbi:MAG: O-antigen ligase family protein [Pyrinomonadaceae bacterium]
MKPVLRARVAWCIGTISFYSLLALIALVAIPYGTAEPWWKALFQCMVFILTGLTVIERLLWRGSTSHHLHLLIPALALVALAFLQTLSWSEYSVAGIDQVARTLSADAFQTRLFVSQLLALVLTGSLLVLHTSNRRRLRLLVEWVIAIGVISACFGLLRQAIQDEPGFVLPYLLPGYGYAQFINSNHFVFLMEMALGLALGIVVCRGASKRRLVLYVIAAIPMWVALIQANSRAGILSILCQVLFLALLVSSNSRRSTEAKNSRAWFRTGRVLAVRSLLIIGLLAGAVITIVLLGGEPLARKLDNMTVELNPKTAETYTLRLNIWQATLDLIKDHPIAGVGFGAYWIAITRYHHASGEITPQEAHSDYLELLASGGIMGLAIGGWFTFAFIRGARQKIRAADRHSRAITLGALAGIMTVAVHSLVDYGLHITINALIFTTLISLVVMNVREEAAESQGQGEAIGISEYAQAS